MLRLSKADVGEKGKLLSDLMEAQEKLSKAVEEYNAAAQAHWDKLAAVVEECNEVILRVSEFTRKVADEAIEYADNRSEAWVESDRGQAYSEWAGEWEGFEPEEVTIEDVVTIDVPDTIQDCIDGLDGLPDEFDF